MLSLISLTPGSFQLCFVYNYSYLSSKHILWVGLPIYIVSQISTYDHDWVTTSLLYVHCSLPVLLARNFSFSRLTGKRLKEETRLTGRRLMAHTVDSHG
jgi:hypothetical protein